VTLLEVTFFHIYTKCISYLTENRVRVQVIMYVFKRSISSVEVQELLKSGFKGAYCDMDNSLCAQTRCIIDTKVLCLIVRRYFTFTTAPFIFCKNSPSSSPYPSVCLSVCLSVCPSVRLSIRMQRFKNHYRDRGTSYFHEIPYWSTTKLLRQFPVLIKNGKQMTSYLNNFVHLRGV